MKWPNYLFVTSLKVLKDIYSDASERAWTPLALLERREWISGTQGTTLDGL